jgi:hypothetical protein
VNLNIVQSVSKKALQLLNSTQIYKEGIHNILNYHNIAKHCKFDAHDTAVPNTATASTPAVEIKMATCFGSKNQSLLHKFKGNFALSSARNLPAGLQFTRGTRILMRPDILFDMPSHPVAHVFRETNGTA